MKKLLIWGAFCLITLTVSVSGQTIAVQDFEVAPATPTWTISSGAGNISTATGTGDTPASQRIRGGARSWQVNNTSATLDLAAVNTTNYSSIKVTVHISSTSTTTGNGAETNDALTVSANLNNAGFPATPDITVTGNNNSRWSYNDTVNATTAAGTPITRVGANGTNNGTIYSTLEITIPDGTTSVALRITGVNNVVQEIWNVDDVSITGLTTTAAPAQVSGRVLDSNGNGISRAQVKVSGGDLDDPVYATTNPFGYFNFEVSAGQTYLVTVNSKSYTFSNPTQVISVNDNVDGLNFIADER